jgi:hypothetical protein
MNNSPERGFTLLIAVILSSVALSIGIALLDIATKQVVLSSSAKQSQVAFYNADRALECALYWDQKRNAFDYTTPMSEVSCGGASSTVSVSGSSPRIRSFAITCGTPGTTIASTTVYKSSDGSTFIYSSGFNTCDATNPRRIERGLKVTY